MSYKIIISFLFISISALICTKPQIREREVADLPPIDSVSYAQCFIKYKSSLYDENSWLVFKLNVVYIKPLSLSSVIESTRTQDSVIVDNLNKAFFKQAISFELRHSSTSYKGYSINDFVNHYKDFEKNNYITILIYPSEEARYSGIAAGIPHTIFGIIDNKIATSTLPHEFGHIIGLNHLFDKDDTDGKNVHSGDKICDTPAFNLMDNKTIDCGYAGLSKYSEEDLEIIIPNYLNYNSEPIDCRDQFTPIQGLSMRWHIENYPALYSALAY